MNKMKDNKKEIIRQAEEKSDLFRQEPKFPRQSLHLELPLAPSVNHMYRFVKGRKFLTRTATQYLATVQSIVKKAIKEQGFKKEGDAVWLICEIVFYFPDRRRRDCHNSHKILADALEGECFIDDRYLLIRDLDVLLDRDNPRLEVTIRPKV